jgi:hypothetical protein
MGAKINAGNARSYEFFDGGRLALQLFFILASLRRSSWV